MGDYLLHGTTYVETMDGGLTDEVTGKRLCTGVGVGGCLQYGGGGGVSTVWEGIHGILTCCKKVYIFWHFYCVCLMIWLNLFSTPTIQKHPGLMQFSEFNLHNCTLFLTAHSNSSATRPHNHHSWKNSTLW